MASKKLLPPVFPSDPTDDIAFEKYNEKLLLYKKSLEASVNEQEAHLEEIVKKLVEDCRQVCKNIENGHCPRVVENAYFFCGDAQELSKGKGARILINTVKRVGKSWRDGMNPDAILLEKLCDPFQGHGLLKEVTKKGKFLSSAVEEICHLAASKKIMNFPRTKLLFAGLKKEQRSG